MDPTTGLLPTAPAPYPTTLEEIHERFVVEAPFPERRQLVFDALKLYAQLIWAIHPEARLRVDGGFVTHKQWAAPEDVDIAVVCSTISQDQLDRAVSAPLFTILNAEGDLVGQRVTLPKSHVMGGLVDAFPLLPGLPATIAVFDRLWTAVTDENKQVVPGLQKGYVEVSNPDA